MKVSAAVLALLLIAASCSQTFSGPAGSDLTTCCSKYTGRKLPQNRIQRYYLTSSNCALPAVMFITKKGNSVCANPNDAWVLSYLQNLKQN
ncbi:PREDICTED: C-C motif chemokine 4-like [Apaloderma vittatum]|uniref:C-C motif chemokine 4 n=1 Tax=Apaloderma vittatum TaxID=57397 RepID=A0A091NIA3_APAVI|nr:PREDICTED: C-C motif chemokine 4-like [Apaloderma vittatum]KFP89171.1 C-C motif chemokine 4 [Apaloderma vittatum]